jgi:carbonic anhydrase
MVEPQCQALIVHCLDFRLQKPINDWLQRHYGLSDYDRVSLAGGVLDLEAVLKQVELCVRVHGIRRVVFVNHEDCRAYGEAGNPDRHVADLHHAEKRCKEQFPHLEVELYYLHLTGIFERIPSEPG